MRLYLCGVRGSTPAPGADFLRYGGHTSCVAIAHDDAARPTLVLDAGTGLRQVTPLLGGQPFDGTILLTHLHWDHVHGLPFFTGGDCEGSRVSLLLPEQEDGAGAEEALAKGMSPPHFPIPPSMQTFGTDASGATLVLSWRGQLNILSITDGTSNTLMFGEKHVRPASLRGKNEDRSVFGGQNNSIRRMAGTGVNGDVRPLSPPQNASAIANTIARSAIVRTASADTAPGTDTPMNTSAPASSSSADPRRSCGFVRSASDMRAGSRSERPR